MRLSTITFGIVLVALVLDAAGGPGWGIDSARAVLAVRMDHGAAAPLYDVLASVFALLPAGEPGFRLAVFGAVLGALTCAGVIEAARVLVPKDRFAGLAGVIVVVLAIYLASVVYVHFRGRYKLRFGRQILDHSGIFAPYNVLMYAFSAVPAKAILDRPAFAHLDPLRDGWRKVRMGQTSIAEILRVVA